MASDLCAREVIDCLGLEPLVFEGGWFRRSWGASWRIPKQALPSVYGGAREAGSAIYYLLSGDDFSALHRLPGVEVFHFYAGDAVRMVLLDARDGSAQVRRLGVDLLAGERPQCVVPAGVWQGCHLADVKPGEGLGWALLGATMAPGFDLADFEIASASDLLGRFVGFDEDVRRLCRA